MQKRSRLFPELTAANIDYLGARRFARSATAVLLFSSALTTATVARADGPPSTPPAALPGPSLPPVGGPADFVVCPATATWELQYYNSTNIKGVPIAKQCLMGLSLPSIDFAKMTRPKGVKKTGFSVRAKGPLHVADLGIYLVEVVLRKVGAPKLVVAGSKDDKPSWVDDKTKKLGVQGWLKKGSAWTTLELLDVAEDATVSFSAIAKSVTCEANEWNVQFFGDKNLGGKKIGNEFYIGQPIAERCDRASEFGWSGKTLLSYDWKGKPPIAGIPASGWSARWTRKLTMKKGDSVRFRLKSTNGSKVYVDSDNMPLLWSWYGPPPIPFEATYLSEKSYFEDKHEVVVDAWSEGATSSLVFEWETCPGGAIAPLALVVPDTALPNTGDVQFGAKTTLCPFSFKKMDLHVYGKLASTCESSKQKCDGNVAASGALTLDLEARLYLNDVYQAPLVKKASYKLNHCADGKWNGNEEEPDCGGSQADSTQKEATHRSGPVWAAKQGVARRAATRRSSCL